MVAREDRLQMATNYIMIAISDVYERDATPRHKPTGYGVQSNNSQAGENFQVLMAAYLYSS
jgi:hypothetical protein